MDRSGNFISDICGDYGNPLQMRHQKHQFRRCDCRSTSVVLILAWLIVFCRKEQKFVREIPKKELGFLILSGIATGASWLCYYYAIQQGQVSVVVPIDRLSILITVLFSVLVLKEKLSAKSWVGLSLLTAGTVCMAVFT